MLEDLTIKDFAIIESEHIEFSKGFTVLSGETGAGKSIIIGAVSFLLGGKAEISQIRAGCHEASVCGTFVIPQKGAASEWLSEHGIEPENDRILLRRFVRDTGKSGAWIGAVPVTRTDLADFSAFLVDIHGQHDHQSLMRVPEHRKFLDARAGITEEVSAFTGLYTAIVEKRKLLAQLDFSDAERAHNIDMYTFAVNEIEEAKLSPGEDESLEAEESRLSSFEKLYAGIESVKTLLDGGESGIIPLLKKARRESQQASSFDRTLNQLDSRLESAFYELSDISEEFFSYSQKLVYDPVHLSEVQERLSLIYNLKKKYASSQSAPLQEVFDYYEDAKRKLEQLSAGGQDKDSLRVEISAL